MSVVSKKQQKNDDLKKIDNVVSGLGFQQPMPLSEFRNMVVGKHPEMKPIIKERLQAYNCRNDKIFIKGTTILQYISVINTVSIYFHFNINNNLIR